MKRLFLVVAAALLATPVQAKTSAKFVHARAYVDHIYREFGREVPPFFDLRSVRYAPKLRALIARDDACARASGGVCALDFVPFCECQDVVPYSSIAIKQARAIGTNGAGVAVLIGRGRNVSTFDIRLQFINGVWYVSDVYMPRSRSLVSYIEAGLRLNGTRP